jgi:hypothetical protein
VTDFEKGLLVGVLIGEGHFGGDGKQPYVTVRMHSRNEALFRWLLEMVPGSRLYGPYYHGGRDYCQWMARGPALKSLVSLLDETPLFILSPPTYQRYIKMKEGYRL